jgi:alkanesulfonate monooxygenase SsuD/methylene tetrahydromethanopterin reductase-like flavin-dependent oxidoreductase (luciferase family)
MQENRGKLGGFGNHGVVARVQFDDLVYGYLAAKTEQIHLGAAIVNPPPQVSHPAKMAEKVACLDHLSEGRFEFGTGRGAGSHEILGFLANDGITDTNATKVICEEVVGEFPKVLLQDTYQGFDGRHWSLPPRKILPKPYGKAHPAMWYAAGNPSSYEMAARKGLGVLGFSVSEVKQLGIRAERLQGRDTQCGADRCLCQ